MDSKKSGRSMGKRRVQDGEVKLRPVGVIRSILKNRGDAPKQGSEGAPDAWLEVKPFARAAVDGLVQGEEVIVLT